MDLQHTIKAVKLEEQSLRDNLSNINKEMDKQKQIASNLMGLLAGFKLEGETSEANRAVNGSLPKKAALKPIAFN